MTHEDGRDLSRRLRWAPRDDASDAVNDPERWDDEVGRADRVSSDIGSDAADAAGPAGDQRSFERRDLDRMDADALDRRRQLWRDTAIILSGLVAALLVTNFVFPQVAGLAAASPSPLADGIGPTASAQQAGGPTHEPTIDPGVGIDATPTPIPVITLPPTGTSPPATPRPVRTPKPTPRPTRPPPTERPTPEPTPEVTPTPAPTVHVSCTELGALTVSCTSTATDAVSGSELWSMGGPGTVAAGGDGADSITFVYDAEGSYHVSVTVTGLDGSSASDGTDVTVSAT